MVSLSIFLATPSGNRSIAIRDVVMAILPMRILVVCPRGPIPREKDRSEETSRASSRLACATNAAVRPTSNKSGGLDVREGRPILADTSIDCCRKSVEAIKKIFKRLEKEGSAQTHILSARKQ